MVGGRRYSILLGALMLLAAAGCQQQGAPPEAAVTAEDCQLGVDAVRIGVQGAMSGSHADYGKQMEMGSTLAAEEINADDGILGCPIELEFRDAELDQDVAITNARYFVDQYGAHFLVGIDSSGVALGLAPVMPELDRILIVTHAGTEALTEEEVAVNGNKHVFRMSVPVYQDAILPALIFGERPELTRFATIGADYEYGHTSWEMFKEQISELNPDAQFVAEAWAPFNTADFSAHLSTVLAEDPDVIFATPWAGEAVALLRQAGGMGAFDDIEVWWQAMGASVDVLQGITPDIQAGAFQDKLWATGRYIFNHPDTEANRQFVEAFRERWDRFPNYSAATTYSAVRAIELAVEETQSLETETVIGALEGLQLETPMGEVQIRPEDHQAVYSVPAGRVVFNEEYGMACVCEDLQIFEASEYYRSPPFP